MSRKIVVAVVAMVIWLSGEARLAISNIWQTAVEIAKRSSGIVSKIAGYSILLFLIGASLLIVSIFIPSISISLQGMRTEAPMLQIIGISFLIIWLVAIWILLNLLQKVLTVSARERYLILVSGAVQKTEKKVPIIILVLICWMLQIFAWPGLPYYIAMFIIAGIIGLVLKANIEPDGNKTPLRGVKAWIILAMVIFTVRIGVIYLQNGKSLVSALFRNFQESRKDSALRESFKHGTRGNRYKISLSRYRHIYGGLPLVYKGKISDSKFIYNAVESKEELEKLEKLIFVPIDLDYKMPVTLVEKYGKLKSHFFNNIPTLENAQIFTIVAPVDCFFEEMKTPTKVVYKFSRQIPITVSRHFTMLCYLSDIKVVPGDKITLQILSGDSQYGWKWGLDAIDYELGETHIVPEGGTEIVAVRKIQKATKGKVDFIVKVYKPK